MSKLIRVSVLTSEVRIGDVIFIHGVGGGAVDTWSSNKDDPSTYWPAWVGKDRPNVGIWSLGYEAAAFAWQGSAMPLFDRAKSSLALLDVEGIGMRPIVFVAHSLGGLLVKQMIQNGLTLGDSRWRAIAEHTKGVVFVATPHTGSDLATFMKFLSRLVTTAAIKDLDPSQAQLRSLNEWYRTHAFSRFTTEVYFETKATTWKGLGVVVVDEASADPGITGVVPIPLDEDH